MAEARLRVSLTEEQVSCFRDRRSHLAGPGAASAAEAARAILGAQAQQEGPALFALSLRTKGRPTASVLRAQLLDASGRRLVRTWGQRDTLHVFDPADWRIVVSARREWPQSGRRGALPSEPDLAAIRSLFEQASGPLFRSDLFAAIPQQFVDEVADHPGVAASGSSAIRFAAARLVWRLALAGDICFAEKRGSKQSYVHRRLWFPDLEWLREAPEVCARERGGSGALLRIRNECRALLVGASEPGACRDRLRSPPGFVCVARGPGCTHRDCARGSLGMAGSATSEMGHSSHEAR